MAKRTIAELVTVLGLSSKSYERDLEKQKRNTRGFANSSKKSFGLAAKAGAAFGTAIVAAFAAAGKSIQTYDEYNRRLKQTEALLKRTGNASGLTATQIDDLSQSIARGTLANEQEVLEAANQLLTFKSIAGDVFEETLRLSQDLAATGFGSVSSSALTLAKALEDPVARLGELSRVGITVSKSQRDMIKELTETGRKAEAQRILLKALAGQIAGSGNAEADGTVAGATDLLGHNWRDLQKTFAESGPYAAAVKGINSVANAVGRLNDFFSDDPTKRLRAVRKELEQLQGGGFAGFGKSGRIKELLKEQASLEQRIVAIKGIQNLESAKAAEASKIVQDEISNELKLEKEKAEAAKRAAAAKAEAAKAEPPTNIGDSLDIGGQFDMFRDTIAQIKSDAATVFEDTRTPLENYSSALERLNVLVNAGAIDWETYRRAITDVQEDFDSLETEGEKAASTLKEGFLSVGDTITRSIADTVRKGKLDFKSLGDSILEELQRIAIQAAIIDPLKNAFSGIANGASAGGGGGIGSFFSGLFGGARASGGPIASGRSYLVGERGPEIFSPNQSGTIAPNGAMGGGTSVNVNIIGGPSQPEVNERQNENGGVDIDVIFDEKIGRSINEGAGRNALSRTFGLAPRVTQLG